MCLGFFRGGKKAPIEPRVQAIQQGAVPFEMDITSFIAPGSNYVGYLKAFGAEE